jgi:hypothetical protein
MNPRMHECSAITSAKDARTAPARSVEREAEFPGDSYGTYMFANGACDRANRFAPESMSPPVWTDSFRFDEYRRGRLDSYTGRRRNFGGGVSLATYVGPTSDARSGQWSSIR